MEISNEDQICDFVKKVKADLKYLFDSLDSDKIGTVEKNTFLKQCKSSGIDLSKTAQRIISSLDNEISFNVIIDKLGYDTNDCMWHFEGISHMSKSKSGTSVTQTNRKTVLSSILPEKQEEFVKLLKGLQANGVEYRQLTCLNSAYTQAVPDEDGFISRASFEKALGNLKNHLPEDSVSDIFSFLCDDQMNINQTLLQKLLNTAKYTRVDHKVFGQNTEHKMGDLLFPKRSHKVLPVTKTSNALDTLWTKIIQRYKSFQKGFTHFDIEKSGKITREHFLCGIDSLNLYFKKAELISMYDHLDRAKKGFIDFQDFARFSSEQEQDNDTQLLTAPYAVSQVTEKSEQNSVHNYSFDSRKQRRSRLFTLPSDKDPTFTYGLKQSKDENLGAIIAQQYLQPSRNTLTSSISKSPQRRFLTNASVKRTQAIKSEYHNGDASPIQWKMGKFKKTRSRLKDQKLIRNRSVSTSRRRLVVKSPLPQLNV